MQALGKKCCIIWHFLPSTLLLLLYFPKFFDDLSFFLHNPLFPFILHPLKNFLPLLKLFPPPKNFPSPNFLLPTRSNFHFFDPPKRGGGVNTHNTPSFGTPAPKPPPTPLNLHPFNLELHPSTSAPSTSTSTP